MPLNEECGLLEWVSGTSALKRILEKEYARVGKRLYVREALSRTRLMYRATSFTHF